MNPRAKDANVRERSCILEDSCGLPADSEVGKLLLLVFGGELSLQCINLMKASDLDTEHEDE